MLIKQNYNSENQEQLHALIQRREQLILFKNQETNRLENCYSEFTRESIKQHVIHIDKQLLQVQSSIEELYTNNIEILDKVSKLRSIHGSTVAITAICEVAELGNIEFASLTALVGLAPFARESGNYKGKRSIFAGKGKLRKAL